MKRSLFGLPRRVKQVKSMRHGKQQPLGSLFNFFYNPNLKPKKLKTIFLFYLCLALCLATILPMLVLYSLSVSGLISASYEVASNNPASEERIRYDILPLINVPRLVDMARVGTLKVFSQVEGEEGHLSIDPDLPLIFDPETGAWRVLAHNSTVVVTSKIFQFHVDMPAWIAIAALPIFSLLVGAVLSIWMSRRVTRPVSQLAEAARAIGQRDLGYRVNADESQELQDLAKSFNRMAEQLEHAELTRRNLMADVAHELRTPLSVLNGNLRALLDGVRTVSEEEIALLCEQTQHLSRLVDDLQELSLAEANQLSLDLGEVDLSALITETAAHFELPAREGHIQLTLDLQAPLIHPALDKDRIRQVLHNLLSNAIKNTPRGGSVSIAGKQVPDQKTISLVISDNGAGISRSELRQIFNRFYRSGEPPAGDHQGSGLGLAIVKAIVESHGGSVEAISDGKGRGSRFVVMLPIRD
jgi:signal transduction histidine kinase